MITRRQFMAITPSTVFWCPWGIGWGELMVQGCLWKECNR